MSWSSHGVAYARRALWPQHTTCGFVPFSSFAHLPPEETSQNLGLLVLSGTSQEHFVRRNFQMAAKSLYSSTGRITELGGDWPNSQHRSLPAQCARMVDSYCCGLSGILAYKTTSSGRHSTAIRLGTQILLHSLQKISFNCSTYVVELGADS